MSGAKTNAEVGLLHRSGEGLQWTFAHSQSQEIAVELGCEDKQACIILAKVRVYKYSRPDQYIHNDRFLLALQTSPTGQKLRLFHSEEKAIQTTESLVDFVTKSVAQLVEDVQMDGISPEIQEQLNSLADVNETESATATSDTDNENMIDVHTAVADDHHEVETYEGANENQEVERHPAEEKLSAVDPFAI
jgi:hypothetical protein